MGLRPGEHQRPQVIDLHRAQQCHRRTNRFESREVNDSINLMSCEHRFSSRIVGEPDGIDLGSRERNEIIVTGMGIETRRRSDGGHYH
jgi:hypothetical protein